MQVRGGNDEITAFLWFLKGELQNGNLLDGGEPMEPVVNLADQVQAILILSVQKELAHVVTHEDHRGVINRG